MKHSTSVRLTDGLEDDGHYTLVWKRDDGWYYMRTDEQTPLGPYRTSEQAVKACQRK
jgi:hypothetical protein